MIGTKVLADTNIFINLSEGKGDIEPHLANKDIFISVVTEIELLGYHKISENEKSFFESLIEDCSSVELIPQIKNLTIRLKQQHRIKLRNVGPPRCHCCGYCHFSGHSITHF